MTEKPLENISLDMSVQFLKGVGPARAEVFEKMGVKTAADLLEYYPRDWFFAPEPVTPGEIIEYTIDLVGASKRFRRGHRIRLDIASSNFPAFDRNMNTGNPTGEDKRGIPATQTIYHQSKYPSYIDLPIITE